MRLRREKTQTRSRQNRKYGGKQLPPAYTPRHVFITHRITRWDSTRTLKIPKAGHVSEAAAYMHVCPGGKGTAGPSSINIISVFLLLLTFPASVQLLFQVLFHDRSHVSPLAALRLQSLTLRPLEPTPWRPALGASS